MKKLPLLLALLIFSMCTHEPENISPDDPNITPQDSVKCDPDTVYFQNTVLPFIQTNCAKSGCHDAATHKEDVILNTYDNIMTTGEITPGNPGESKLFQAITEDDPEKRMPKDAAPLTAEQIGIIETWILQGARNNHCDSEDCDTINVTYSLTILPIVQNLCLGCHNSTLSSGGFDFSKHQDLATVALSGQLMRSVRHDPSIDPVLHMPQGAGKLSVCKIGKFQKWVNDGAPNNK